MGGRGLLRRGAGEACRADGGGAAFSGGRIPPSGSGQRLAHLRGIRHRPLAGIAAADVERRAAAHERLAAKQGRARLAGGGIVMGDDAVRKVARADLAAQRVETGLARRADEGQLHRAFQEEIDDGQALRERPRLAADRLAPRADRPHRFLAQVRAIEMVREAREGHGRRGIGAGNGAVVALPRADDERLVPPSGREEASLLGGEVLPDPVRERRRLVQVLRRAARFVKVDERLGKEGVVFEVGVEVGPARAPRP